MASWLDNLKANFMTRYLKSIIQHGLTALSAVLVAKGIIDADQASEFVATNVDVIIGSITYLLAQVWAIKSN
jgi:nicotinate-nucleotide pyrophosphorylase